MSDKSISAKSMSKNDPQTWLLSFLSDANYLIRRIYGEYDMCFWIIIVL